MFYFNQFSKIFGHEKNNSIKGGINIAEVNFNLNMLAVFF